MNRVLVCLCIALVYLVFRGTPASKPPVPPGPPDIVAIESLAKFRSSMTKEDRDALSQAYDILSRAVAANPADAPVMPSTAAVHDAHRAAILFVWRGVLGNEPGKYPGLREELEGLVNRAVGTADVPLNPTIQRDAATVFGDIARSFR